MRTRIAIALLFILGQISCSDDSSFDLRGTWVDTGSPSLRVIEFYSGSQGKLGYFANNDERNQEFSYRLLEDKIAIDFVGDDAGEAVHDLIIHDKNQIRISGLTDIPEDPSTTYRRFNVVSKVESDEIILGVDDIYIDYENGLRLQSQCTGDSRCPKGAHCIWAGYAQARLFLAEGGNDHVFELATVNMATLAARTDTLINEITYTLVDVIPHPDISNEHKLEDYKVKISITKSN